VQRQQREAVEYLGRVKQAVKAAEGKLMTETKFSSTKEEDLPEGEKAILRKLNANFTEEQIPDEKDALEALLAREEDRIAMGRTPGNKQDAENYEKAQEEERELDKEIDTMTKTKSNLEGEMDQKLEKWLSPLRELVQRISEKFSTYFGQLGCAGEIRLDAPADKYDMKSYGITILVKFRDGACLRPLDALVQSGGERSLATMVFLMALQDSCPVPFRCVDEINQGMDPVNERKVFNMMVNLLSNPDGDLSKTQYFLLTPKLLNGLEFNEKVAVHVVYNGPTIENAHAWNPQKFLDQ